MAMGTSVGHPGTRVHWHSQCLANSVLQGTLVHSLLLLLLLLQLFLKINNLGLELEVPTVRFRNRFFLEVMNLPHQNKPTRARFKSNSVRIQFKRIQQLQI